jgi:hypothetical protein
MKSLQLIVRLQIGTRNFAVKNLLGSCLFSALLALPAYGQAAEIAKDTANCPMMGTMQRSMGAMMKDMNVMMADTTDPAMKARMEEMQDKMSAMMASMQKMGGGMMGGGMMHGGAVQGSAPSTTPSAKSDDPASHHPN